MSGWENLPKETPAATPSVAPSDEGELIEDGDFIRAAEWYFPALWIGMLIVVAFIGVYSAVGKLPNSPW
jgi:hypothetical protein